MHQQRTERRSLKMLLGVLFCLGLGCLAFELWHVLQVRACSRWPRVEATVTRLSATFDPSIPIHNKWRTVWRSTDIDFRYTYEVNGRRYESSRFYFLPGFPASFALVNRFPAGTHFLAYRHPTDPSIAIVEPEGVHYWAVGIGIALLSLCAILFATRRQHVQGLSEQQVEQPTETAKLSTARS
jgi:hypothetical protein